MIERLAGTSLDGVLGHRDIRGYDTRAMQSVMETRRPQVLLVGWHGTESHSCYGSMIHDLAATIETWQAPMILAITTGLSNAPSEGYNRRHPGPDNYTPAKSVEPDDPCSVKHLVHTGLVTYARSNGTQANRTTVPPAGAAMSPTEHSRCTPARSGFGVVPLNSSANTAFISYSAKAAPMHLRAPPPNGSHA
jgi:hypothetical protein